MASYYLKPPREQYFYRILAVLMNFTSLGDSSWWGLSKPNILFRLNNLIIIFSAPVVLISQIAYVFINFNDLTFDTLGIIFSIAPVTFVVNVNIFSAKSSKYYKALMQDFMCKIHLNNANTEKAAFTREKIIRTERISRWTGYYLMFFFSMNWFTWIIISIVINIKNAELIQNHTVKLQTCVYLWLPIDYSYNYRNWIIVHLINVYLVAMGVIILWVAYTLNYVFMFHLIGHIQILKHKLMRDFSKDDNDEVTKDALVEILKYHEFIIEVFKNVQAAFGMNVAANYLYNLIGDSIIVYQIMYGNKENMLLYICMMASFVGGLLMMSVVLEEIRRQTLNLSDVVYSMRWETMSISNKKNFLLLLLRVQPSMEFIALCGLRTGVRPMISIIKSTFSYYVMLKSSIAEKS